jgi:uncharacterized protein YodC (DUF2158 family)
MPEKPRTLAVNDTVTHRTLHNSPRMRVKTMSSSMVTCDWFDKNQAYHVMQFPIEDVGDERG